LREVRADRNLTQIEFGEKISVSGEYVSQLETGKRTNPSENLIFKICEKFNVNRDWLIDGKGERDLLLKDPGTVYEPHGGWEPRTTDDLAGPKMSRAFTLLSKIYDSENKEMIRAAFSMLNALAHEIEKNNKKNCNSQ